MAKRCPDPRRPLKVCFLLGWACACGEIYTPVAATTPGGGESPADAHGPSWSVISVPTGMDPSPPGSLSLSTEDVALFVDAGSVPHIAYALWPDKIAHAWLSGDHFDQELLDDARMGWFKSWAVEENDNVPNLVFGLDRYNIGLFEARQRSGIWETSYSEFSSDPSLVAGAPAATRRNGIVHIARVFERPLQQEEYPAEFAGALLRHVPMYGEEAAPFEGPGTISFEQVPPSTAIAVDAESTVHLLYTAPSDDYTAYVPDPELYAPYTVRYTTVRNGLWSAPETLSEQPGAYAGLSLVTDERGNVHASFGEGAVADPPDNTYRRTAVIRYLRRGIGESSWLRETVSPAAPVLVASASLGVDSSGDVHLAYCRASEESPQCNALGIAHRSSNQWTWDVIDERCMDTGEMATLAVDRSDGLHVAYHGCDNSLAYAYRAGVE